MLRLPAKLPCFWLARVPKRVTCRTNSPSRFQSSSSSGSGGGGRILILGVGTLTLAAGGTVAYALFDPEFRKWLEGNVPLSDTLLKLLEGSESVKGGKEKIESFTKGVKDMIPLKSSTSKMQDSKQEPTMASSLLHPAPAPPTDVQTEESPSISMPVFQTHMEEDDDENASCPIPPYFSAEDQDVPSPVGAAPCDSPPRVNINRCKRGKDYTDELGDLEDEEPVAEGAIVRGSAAVVSPKQKAPPEGEPTGSHVRKMRKNIQDMETGVIESTKATVLAFDKAIKATKRHNDEIYETVEASVDKFASEKSFPSLEETKKGRDQAVRCAKDSAMDAIKKIDRLALTMSEMENNADKETKRIIGEIRGNLATAKSHLESSQSSLQNVIKEGNIFEKYKDLVTEARSHFEGEISGLIPGLKVGEDLPELKEAEMNLYILHAYKKVLYYQKELAKLETLGQEQMKATLGEGAGDYALLKTELEKQRRELELEFQSKTLKMHNQFELELRQQLARQAGAHSDHLRDTLCKQEIELKRHLEHEMDEKMTMEKLEYKSRLASMASRLKGIDTALKARSEADKQAEKAHALWAACQTLFRSLKTGKQGVPWEEQIHPLNSEVQLLSKAAAPGDPVVAAVVTGIPQEALERGVFPEDALRERFLKVENLGKKLALVGEEGSPLLVYFMSFVQDFLLIKSARKIPPWEIADEPIDIGALDTHDILDRARYWIDRGDLTQALRYVNLLQGAPRFVASDWIKEARILLETQQAASVLLAHAANSPTIDSA